MEIIPNWHPLLVHFTVALLPVAAGFFIMAATVKGRFKEQWLAVAYWTLWTGVGISLLTVASGIYAYNTVDHDTPSHVAMTLHRNWALATFLLYVVIGIWSVLQFRGNKQPHPVFLGLLVVAFVVLGTTAWRGGELVYRYGLGVKSLPVVSAEGHAHDHDDGHDHGHGDAATMNQDDRHDDDHGDAIKQSDHHDDGHAHGDTAGTETAEHHDDGHHDDAHSQAVKDEVPANGANATAPSGNSAPATATESDHHHDANAKPHTH